MPLSTSSSERQRAHRAIAALLALLVVYLGVLEAASRTVVPRFSASTRRAEQDFEAARQLRAATSDNRKLLLVGNSLLLHGINRHTLRRELEPGWASAFLPMENTSYWDWYFGLRRLLAEGSRPSAVILSINVRNLVTDSTNGEQFAHTMMQRSDLLRVADVSNLDNTTASGYFFASFSSWLGGRVGIRNWLLQRWLPHADLLVLSFIPRGGSAFADGIVESHALPRLKQMQDLCRSYGARFIYVVPATRNTSDPAMALQTAAAAAGIDVIVPFAPGEMPAEGFEDGFHLNERGAASFTDRLAPILRSTLDSGYPAAAGG